MKIMTPVEARLTLASDPSSYTNQEDIESTEQLRKCLDRLSAFESPEEGNHRIEVMEKFIGFVQRWVEKVRANKDLYSEDGFNLDPTGFNAKVFECGSYLLNVHMRGADIDLLVLCTDHVDRTNIFQTFLEAFKSEAEVTLDRNLERAHTPTIKVTWDGIQLDIAFARLGIDYIPNDMKQLRSSSILKQMEWPCIRSMNSWRDAMEIQDMIPNLDAFKLAIIAIKLWSHKRGIHSNGLGFLGGISYTLMLLKIALLYPKSLGAGLVHKYFHTFCYWRWPEPVIVRPEPDFRLFSNLPIWDASKERDSEDVMPILTPSYPRRNSSPHVNSFNLKTLNEEISRGLEICAKIRLGELYWDDLFDPINYFEKNQCFIAIVVENESDWASYIRARLRYLTEYLSSNISIKYLRILPGWFTWSSSDQKNFGPSKNYRLYLVAIDHDGDRDEINCDLEFHKYDFIGRVRTEGAERFTPSMEIDLFYMELEEVMSSIPSEELAPDYPYNLNDHLPDPDCYDGSQSNWLDQVSTRIDGSLIRPKNVFLKAIKPDLALLFGKKSANWQIDPVSMMKSCYSDDDDYDKRCWYSRLLHPILKYFKGTQPNFPQLPIS